MRLKDGAKLKTVEFSKGQLLAHMDDGFRLKVPLSRFPQLVKASAEMRQRFVLSPDGLSVSWPGLPLELSLADFSR